jgi:hypothetical protein
MKDEVKANLAVASVVELPLVRRRYEHTENFRAVSNHQIRRTT